MDQPVGLPTALPGVEDSGRWAGDGRWDYEKVLDSRRGKTMNIGRHRKTFGHGILQLTHTPS